MEVDDFIAKLWAVHLAVSKEGYVQVTVTCWAFSSRDCCEADRISKDLSLGLFRSDYMVHKEPSDPAAKPTIRQVEFNTIASSFGGLACKVSSLHRYVSRILAWASL